jgi:transposase
MDRHRDSAQVQRLEVVELGRRRRWPAEAKLRIVEESFAGWRQYPAPRFEGA